MPRYFFDVDDGTVRPDTDGTDLPGIADARAHALRTAAARTGDPAMLNAGGGAIVVEVRDADRAHVLTVRLAFDVESYQNTDASGASEPVAA